jgi:hypothetical protein
MFNVCNDLIEAYVGYNEDEWEREHYEEFGAATSRGEKVPELSAWMKDKAVTCIIAHTPEQRLNIYLEWNGIFGYSKRIYDIATGHFTVKQGW